MSHFRGIRHWQYYPGSGCFKRSTKLFFSGSNQDPPGNDTQSGVPFEHESFTPKSSFNLVRPFQLESMFCSIEQDLHRQNIENLERKNLTKEEHKAIRSLKNNKDIVIKPADKGSAIVILHKQSYINEGQKQPNNTQFYEQTDSDLTGEVIHRINIHVYNMLQKGQISQNTCNYLTTDIDRTQQFYFYQRFTRMDITHQENVFSQAVVGPQKKHHNLWTIL